MQRTNNEITESKVISKEEIISEISQLEFERDNLGCIQKELNVELEEVEDEISQWEAELKYFDKILVEVDIENKDIIEGDINYYRYLDPSSVEDIAQFLFVLTKIILDKEDSYTTASDILFDLSLLLMDNKHSKGEFYNV